jgi:hypothetical protein
MHSSTFWTGLYAAKLQALQGNGDSNRLQGNVGGQAK